MFKKKEIKVDHDIFIDTNSFVQRNMDFSFPDVSLVYKQLQ